MSDRPERHQSRIHVSGDARGDARLYQVGQGVQNVSNYYFSSYAGPAGPKDLPGVRLWLERASSDYRAIANSESGDLPQQALTTQKQLNAIKASLDDPSNAGKDTLRHLAIAGI